MGPNEGVAPIPMKTEEALVAPREDNGRAIREILELVRGLAEHLQGLEQALAATTEELAELRRLVKKLDAKVARAKQVKRIKKFLDQVELVDVGPQGS